MDAFAIVVHCVSCVRVYALSYLNGDGSGETREQLSARQLVLSTARQLQTSEGFVYVRVGDTLSTKGTGNRVTYSRRGVFFAVFLSPPFDVVDRSKKLINEPTCPTPPCCGATRFFSSARPLLPLDTNWGSPPSAIGSSVAAAGGLNATSAASAASAPVPPAAWRGGFGRSASWRARMDRMNAPLAWERVRLPAVDDDSAEFVMMRGGDGAGAAAVAASFGALAAGGRRPRSLGVESGAFGGFSARGREYGRDRLPMEFSPAGMRMGIRRSAPGGLGDAGGAMGVSGSVGRRRRAGASAAGVVREAEGDEEEKGKGEGGEKEEDVEDEPGEACFEVRVQMGGWRFVLWGGYCVALVAVCVCSGWAGPVSLTSIFSLTILQRRMMYNSGNVASSALRFCRHSRGTIYHCSARAAAMPPSNCFPLSPPCCVFSRTFPEHTPP